MTQRGNKTQDTVDVSVAGRVRLGDLEVNRMGYGTMRLTGSRGAWPTDVDGAVAVLRAAVDAGVTYFDTADIYGPGVSEELVAKALAPYDGLVIGTKGGFVPDFDKGIPLPADGRPEALKTACEASLRRLRMDRIDLYQLHTPDPEVPIEESVGALVELQQAGKIHHIGVSNVGRRHLAAIEGIADIVSVQNRYGLGDRHSEAVLAWCEERDLAFLPWGPLNSSADLGAVIDDMATQTGHTPAQISLAWLLARSPVMLPIPGTSSAAHLRENLSAVYVDLTAEQLTTLDNAWPPSNA